MTARARSTMPARRFAAALFVLAAVVALAARTATAADIIPCPDDARACLLRTYYVAAEEVEWDYAPTGTNIFSNTPIDDDDGSSVYTKQDTGRIGRKYKKAIYNQYTDASFKTQVPRDPGMGLLGPVLRAEVGNVLKIVFINKASMPFSMHPHGVSYDKDNEGANGGAEPGAGAEVAPGGNFTYIWQVPERAGPMSKEPGSVQLWGYHSHANEGDIYAGLVGALAVYTPGSLNSTHQPKLGTDAYPIDKEVFQMYLVLDENKSAYLADNVAKYAGNTTFTKDEQAQLAAAAKANPAINVTSAPPTEDFNESNKMHSINGLFWGNLPGLNFTVGERVRWFLLGFGTEVDIHTVHWHGMTLTSEGQRRDVIDLLPASFRVADMVPDTEGNWLLHCHVGDHFMAGMIAFMNIVEKGAEDAKSAAGRVVAGAASLVAASVAVLAAWL
ncbi:hypothetical protein AMAG_08550 [Allomyces macrogynus ATCC 38327]|uniref:Plastocyanin-like domain-containing protein n=1 Tax=Allomyces macrogynus (strain ATCC 38327) TaxID=578462 RepID=A0A0L0SLY7_ALLM3|nr:hypothetical protein AMAG_08550 [Allomyces macrogynus ATCC 38327]|eukprot:KNE63419.1 hypothetical protein AMAG_08550 [Allomyces macrogynus ATCC 38327]